MLHRIGKFISKDFNFEKNRFKRRIVLMCCIILSLESLNAQDSTDVSIYDPSQFEDASDAKKYCTQKVLNQSPTKLIGVGYEHNFRFENKNIEGSATIRNMGGVRTILNILTISTNRLVLMAGTSYWGSRMNVIENNPQPTMKQVYKNGMDIEGINLLMFKPLDQKHFLIAQANADASTIGSDERWQLTKSAITIYGSAIYGWKKGDYRMMGVGASRTYRMGRPIVVPVILYNQTFNDRWGVESLLPARAHLRYNASANTMLLAGYELEGQQFDLKDNTKFLQRGEIKPRLVLEQKLKGSFWLSAQLGYRFNGRFELVDRYDGQEQNLYFTNTWGGSPYVNLSINFVSL